MRRRGVPGAWRQSPCWEDWPFRGVGTAVPLRCATRGARCEGPRRSARLPEAWQARMRHISRPVVCSVAALAELQPPCWFGPGGPVVPRVLFAARPPRRLIRGRSWRVQCHAHVHVCNGVFTGAGAPHCHKTPGVLKSLLAASPHSHGPDGCPDGSAAPAPRGVWTRAGLSGGREGRACSGQHCGQRGSLGTLSS